MDLDRVQRVHTIGYELHNAEFTAGMDYKFDVAGVRAEGSRGDVNNIPLWIASILERNGVGEMKLPDMVTELKQALSKEKMVGEYMLATLNEHFYIRLRRAMENLDRHDFDRVESMLQSLFRMRRGKLVKIADSTKMTPDMRPKLTVEEVVFYKAIHANSAEFESKILGVSG